MRAAGSAGSLTALRRQATAVRGSPRASAAVAASRSRATTHGSPAGSQRRSCEATSSAGAPASARSRAARACSRSRRPAGICS